MTALLQYVDVFKGIVQIQIYLIEQAVKLGVQHNAWFQLRYQPAQ